MSSSSYVPGVRERKRRPPANCQWPSKKIGTRRSERIPSAERCRHLSESGSTSWATSRTISVDQSSPRARSAGESRIGSADLGEAGPRDGVHADGVAGLVEKAEGHPVVRDHRARRSPRSRRRPRARRGPARGRATSAWRASYAGAGPSPPPRGARAATAIATTSAIGLRRARSSSRKARASEAQEREVADRPRPGEEAARAASRGRRSPAARGRAGNFGSARGGDVVDDAGLREGLPEAGRIFASGAPSGRTRGVSRR